MDRQGKEFLGVLVSLFALHLFALPIAQYTWSLHVIEMAKVWLLHGFVQYIDNGKTNYMFSSMKVSSERCLGP